MTTQAEDIIEEVGEVIQELVDEGLAQEFTVTKREPGPYNSESGSVSIVESTQIVQGVIFDSFSEPGIPSSSINMNDSLIKTGDRRVLLLSKDVNGLPVDIKPDYFISDVEKQYTVILLGKINPGGVVIAYDLIVRG